MLMKPSQLGASSPGSRFLRSVHLETDLPDADSLQGYLVTSGTRTVLPRLGLARQTSSANGPGSAQRLNLRLDRPTSWPSHPPLTTRTTSR